MNNQTDKFRMQKQRDQPGRKRPEFRLKLGRLTITGTQLLCVVAGILLGLMSLALQSSSSQLKEGNILERTEPGTAGKSYELEVSGITENREAISVYVEPRSLTEEEADLRFTELMEALPAAVCGNNENLNHVTEKLDLTGNLPGFEDISISISPDDRELIYADGRIQNADLCDPAETSLTVHLLSGEWKADYQLPVTVYPGEALPEDRLKELKTMIESAEETQRNTGRLVLPSEVGGLPVRYSEKKSMDWIRMILLGAAAAVLLGLKPVQDRKQELKRREQELLLDYSEVVSKLMVYMGAGLTIRNAWLRIGENYVRERERGQCRPRAVYEEIYVLCCDLQKGIPEGRVYREFAERCRLKCYLKLVSILEQNRKNGDGSFENALRLEVQDAFELRKNTARRLGEEAGTKLTLPLIISMATIMVIMALPAVTSLN